MSAIVVYKLLCINTVFLDVLSFFIMSGNVSMSPMLITTYLLWMRYRLLDDV